MSEQIIHTAGSGLESKTVASTASSSPRSFAKCVAWTVAAGLAMLIGGVGSSIVVARWLGAPGLGQLAVVNVTVALALQVGSAGLPSAMVYFVAKDRRHFEAEAANALLFS